MAKREKKDIELLAKRRAEVILKVRAGQMSVTEAARELGISRKTYYEWEARGLQAMLEALQDGKAGRPAKKVDREKEELKQKVESLEKELKIQETALKVRNYLQPISPLASLEETREMSGKTMKKSESKKKRERK